MRNKKLLGWGAIVIGGALLAHALAYQFIDISLIRVNSKWGMVYNGLAAILGGYFSKAVATAAWLCIAAGFLYCGARLIKPQTHNESQNRKRR